MKTLSELKKGEAGIIKEFTDKDLSLKLLELGLLPGELIRVENIAPFGDPISISISGTTLSMRKSEAATVLLEMNVKGYSK